jgi:hypothetical protein
MYSNQRRVCERISDDVVIRDATTKTRDLLISVLCVIASPFYVSHVVGLTNNNKVKEAHGQGSIKIS